MRPHWEVLIGDTRKLDYLASKRDVSDAPHPMQELIEKIIDEVLDDMEKEIFYMRFGEQLPHRAIAERFGYASHQTFQRKIEVIMKKVRDALESY